MGVYELSGAGSAKTPRTVYSSMNANNQYGAMVPIASVALSGSSNTVISNIPQTYQDLRIVFNARLSTTETSAGFFGFLLDNTGAVYSTTTLDGNGSSATSTRTTNSANGISYVYMGGNATANILASNTIDILNYASTTTFKTALTRSAGDSNGAGQVRTFATLYSITAAVTQITIPTAGFTWGSGSTFTLYGIRAVSS